MTTPTIPPVETLREAHDITRGYLADVGRVALNNYNEDKDKPNG